MALSELGPLRYRVEARTAAHASGALDEANEAFHARIHREANASLTHSHPSVRAYDHLGQHPA